MALSFINYTTYDVATGKSYVLNKPTNTAEGDIMFAFFFVSAAYVSAPSGWSAGYSGDNCQLFYKVAGASEPSSYTFTAPSSNQLRGTIYTWRGDFNKTSPILAVSNTSYRTDDTIVRAASMNVSKANSPLLYFGYRYKTSSVTFTKPSVPTTDWVEDVDAGSTTSDTWQTVGHMIWSSSGNTGDIDITMSVTGGQSLPKHAFAIALTPIAIGPANVKTINGLAIASVKTLNGLEIASVKTVNGLA